VKVEERKVERRGTISYPVELDEHNRFMVSRELAYIDVKVWWFFDNAPVGFP
jgi:hypothetical protein